MPKVSIVMPVYNAERYLRQCLDSVITQTLEDIEIICVDDGSTDSSPRILEDYAARDPRIRIITQPNGGYGKAMNTGLDAATGEYVGSVEPDDYVSGVMFEHLWKTAERHGVEVVKGDFFSFTGSGDDYHADWCELCPTKGFYGNVLDPQRSNALFWAMCMTWAGIYRRDFLERYHIRHNETPGAAFQDNGFWMQIFSQAHSVYFLNEANYYYRLDNASSSINSYTAARKIIDEYRLIREFLERDPERWERLKLVYGYFYFDNLLARLSHVAGEAQTEYKRFMARELHRYHSAGEVDFSYFPDYMVGEFAQIALDPDSYVPEDHVSVEANAWNEMIGRHERTGILRLSNSPYKVVSTYGDAIVPDPADVTEPTVVPESAE